ncbi:J domain-containing protein [Ehrlichia minasensis]|nr:DnaJ domain-containing protein [Ehrlichia minasensis]
MDIPCLNQVIYMLFIFLIIFSIIGVIFVLPILALFIFLILKRNSIINMSEIMTSAFNKVMNETNMYSNIRSTGSSLSKAEALEILGLEKNASPEQINTAYHKLMKSMHPDKGGSPYFAQKLNEARDTLLG